MAETCLRGDGRFGVVLIERGFEVGGGDSRFDVGTVGAASSRPQRTPDGRYLLATVGTERFRIKKWLDDDPFPRRRSTSSASRTRVDAARARGATTCNVCSAGVGDECGAGRPRRAGRFRQLDDDPVRASYEAAAVAPIGPLDAQRLLELDDPRQRFDVARVDCSPTRAEVLELRLAGR